MSGMTHVLFTAVSGDGLAFILEEKRACSDAEYRDLPHAEPDTGPPLLDMTVPWGATVRWRETVIGGSDAHPRVRYTCAVPLTHPDAPA